MIGEHLSHDEQRDKRDHDRQDVETAGLAQRFLEPAQPLDVTFGVEHEIQKNHKEKDPAEGGDRGMRVPQPRRVLVRVVQREVEDLERAQMSGDGDDDDREQQAHPEDRDQNADSQEDLLPEIVHPAQDRRVDHSIVEGQAYLEYSEDGDERGGLRAPDHSRQGDTHYRNRQ